MSEQFQALPLKWKGASAAYPLVQMHDAGITLEKWLTYARPLCSIASDMAGLIAIEDRRGIIHALYSYRVELDLRLHKRLCLGQLIVAHFPGSGIDAAIIASAKNVSEQFGCQVITIEQPFGRPSGTLAGCPTARLMQAGRTTAGSARRH